MGDLGRGRKQVQIWRIIPAEGECGKWKLVKGENIMRSNEGPLREEDDHPLPSMADLLATGLKVASKEALDSAFSQKIHPPQSSNCIQLSNCKPNCPDFPAERDNNPNGHASNKKEAAGYNGHVYASNPMQNCNNSDQCLRVQTRPEPPEKTEKVTMSRETGKKRPPLSSSFRRQPATVNSHSKADAIQNFGLVENSSLVNSRPTAEVGHESGSVFEAAADKSAGMASPSLKRPRDVHGKCVSSEAFNINRAGQQQITERTTMFQTAAGNPMTVSLPSIKRARSIFCEHPPLEVLEAQGRPKTPKMNTAAAMFQTAAENPLIVSSSSMRRARDIFCEHPTSEVLDPIVSPEPQTMNKATPVFQIPTGNTARVSSSSTNRGQAIFCEGHTSEVLAMHDRRRPETMTKATALFPCAAGNPMTVSSSSIEKVHTIFREGPMSEPIIHNRSMSQADNNTSTLFQTSEVNHLTVSSASIERAKTISKEEDQDVRTLQNCNHIYEMSNNNKNFGSNKGNTQTALMFQTAPGQPMAVSKSSMKIAQSILSEDAELGFGRNVHSAANFQAAAGKPVEASPYSMKGMLAIGGKVSVSTSDLVINETGDRGQDHKWHSGFANQAQFQDGNGVALTFETGTGKPVVISSNSMKTACTILCDDPELKVLGDTRCQSCSTTAYMQSAPPGCMPNMSRHNPNGSTDLSGQIGKNMVVAPHPYSCSHKSLFLTGSGKSVCVSIAGLSKAKALLEANDVQTSISTKVSEGTASMHSGWISGQSKCSSNEDPTITTDCSNMYSPILPDAESSEMHQFMFQTAVGRSVNVSTTAMKRAMDLLGDERNNGAARVKPNSSSFSIQSVNDIEKNMVAFVEPPPLLFQTAGGRSVSISNDAMKRAMNLLGEVSGISSPVMDVQMVGGDLSDSSARHFLRMGRPSNEAVSNKENIPYCSFGPQAIASQPCAAPKKLSHAETVTSSPKDSILSSKAVGVGRSSMPLKVDKSGFCMDNENSCPKTPLLCQNELSHLQEPADCLSGITKQRDISTTKDTGTRKWGKRKVCISPLVEISNKSLAYNFDNHCQRPGTTADFQKSILGSKRRSGLSRSISPFKQPRRSRFLSPYDVNPTCAAMQPALPVQTFPQAALCEVKLHSPYPSNRKRMTLLEYFGGPPHQQQALWYLSNEVQSMTADAAQHYRFQTESASGDETLGSHDFWRMLLQSGANQRHATAEWVANHYKWIVWKLACIERSYARQAGGKYLTVKNVLEELKYRYEREVNRGHRSPLKKIMEGDAAVGSMMVLCVSAVRVWGSKELDEISQLEGPRRIAKDGANCIDTDMQEGSSARVAKIEITDGWYCLNAILDEGLSKQLFAGKLFVGQKLRICGARLHGWVGPLPPLEAFQTVSLVLHINGTYRAHWAERLSFCRGLPVPLAFRCIKAGGGPVPRTLVGVTRIYPTLYKERLANHGFIIRTERAEDKMLHLYNERRAHIVEDVVLKAEKENFHLPHGSDKDKDEGAWLYSLLETAAEPELIMADMTSAQLAAFAAYKTKREAVRQASIQNHIQQALEDADLDSRKVTPFMRVRVVGLTCKCANNSNRKSKQAFTGRLEREGLVTIWQPTEKQVLELEEGAIYCVSGLVPLAVKSGDNSNENILQLQGNRSTTWDLLPQSICKTFEFLFSPRSALLLSNLGKVPLYSEFDVAAFVVHVGEPYTCGLRKRQWLFVSDGSAEIEESSEQSEIILVIDFSSSIDSFIPIAPSLAGFTVGFCNLVKNKRDHRNSLWVAETGENSIHSLNFSAAKFCHLKAAADSVDKWAKSSLKTVEKLQQRVSGIVSYSM